MSLRRVTGPFAVASGAALVAAAGFVAGLVMAARGPLPRAAAMTSLADDSFAVCTAPIDAQLEGIFLLDFETGDLTGGVLNQATAKWGASFRHNVLKDLGFKAGKVKNPKFLLVPGMAAVGGTGSGPRMAPTVLYVTDAATGVTAAYGIPWAGPAAGGAAVADLVLLDLARPRGGGAGAP